MNAATLGYRTMLVKDVKWSDCAGCGRFFAPAQLFTPTPHTLVEFELERVLPSGSAAPIRGIADLKTSDLRMVARCAACCKASGLSGVVPFATAVEQIRRAVWRREDEEAARRYEEERAYGALERRFGADTLVQFEKARQVAQTGRKNGRFASKECAVNEQIALLASALNSRPRANCG